MNEESAHERRRLERLRIPRGVSGEDLRPPKRLHAWKPKRTGFKLPKVPHPLDEPPQPK